jgi:hypothetical protein
MQQTSLNLIAIGVFTITMLSLLGPLLNISPAVPAIATFTFLGLATIDTLSWRGRGVNLLVDWVAGASPQYRDRIIRHEAGHFLVAYLLEISITGYALSAWEALKQKQPGQGGVTFAPLNLTSPVSAVMIDRYCTVWMAGIAAETLVYKSTEGGAEDRQQLREVLALLKRPSSEILQKERFAILQATTLIQDHWAAYEVLVTAMERRLSVAECYELIQQHRSEQISAS